MIQDIRIVQGEKKKKKKKVKIKKQRKSMNDIHDDLVIKTYAKLNLPILYNRKNNLQELLNYDPQEVSEKH